MFIYCRFLTVYLLFFGWKKDVLFIAANGNDLYWAKTLNLLIISFMYFVSVGSSVGL